MRRASYMFSWTSILILMSGVLVLVLLPYISNTSRDQWQPWVMSANNTDFHDPLSVPGNADPAHIFPTASKTQTAGPGNTPIVISNSDESTDLSMTPVASLNSSKAGLDRAFPDESRPRSGGDAPWRGLSDCPPQMRYAPSRSLPLTALASFPGSGNTWVRHLLQLATGIYTGSVYKDRSLRSDGFPGEYRRDGSVLVIKTHYPYVRQPLPGPQQPPLYTRALLIIRDPYDSLVADFKRYTTKNHTAQVAQQNFTGAAWVKFRDARSRAWIDFHDTWLHQFEGPLHIINYERLQSNLSSELSTTLRFLGWNISSQHMQCVLHHSEGKFHRRPIKMEVDPFKGFNHTQLDEWVDRVREWSWKSDTHLPGTADEKIS